MNEKISALSDAELARYEWDSTLRALASSDDLRKAWERYHLIGTAIRDELHVMVHPNLADRIAAQLQYESESPSSAVPFRRRVPRGIARSIVRGAAGLAVAASVAAVSVFGLRFIWPQEPNQFAQIASATSAPVAAAKKVAPRQGMQWDKSEPEMENALNLFLVQHSEFTPASGIGVMSYVRIGGRDSDQE